MTGVDRPSVFLVSPAWGRLAVSRFVFAQRAHLARELAPRGIDVQSVIVADDENLEIAREHGFATVEMDNQGLGRRFNAGYELAAREGADWLVHIGSDDWVHPDLFLPLLYPLEPRPVLSGRRIAFCDLLTGRMSRAELKGPHGVIPWVLPRHVLKPSGFQPIRPERMSGIDGDLVRGMRRAGVRTPWVFHDPHELCRVDFKSGTNINTFKSLPISLTGARRSNPWKALAEFYPQGLVDMAYRAHLELQGD